MPIKFTDNASTSLLSGIADTDTTLTVQAGKGDLFPVAGSGDWFYATLVRLSDGAFENVKCTARTPGSDTMTVERAQGGTSALEFSASDVIELRPIAASFDEFLPVGTYYSQAAADAQFYSRTQVDNLLAGKSDTDHNHAGVYEPVDLDILRADTPDVLTAGFAGTAVALNEASLSIDLTASNFFTLAVTGPVTIPDVTIPGRGDWCIRVTGTGAVSFNAAYTIADGHEDPGSGTRDIYIISHASGEKRIEIYEVA